VLERTLQLSLAGSSETRDIIVRIGLPEPDPLPGGDFRVHLEIDGFAEPERRYIHGVDELQALQAGCWMVPHLVFSLTPADAKVTWLGDEDLGFGHSPGCP
jgi:hypothetical protein